MKNGRKAVAFNMTSDVAPSDNGSNVPTTSAELDFALVLARVIGSIESDPTQLRSAVYELARIKLEREAWQRNPSMSVSEIRHLMLALDAAIDRVESVSLRHDELRALRSLDKLIESSGRRTHHSINVERAPVLMINQAASAISDGSRSSTVVLSALRHARKGSREGLRSLRIPLLIGSIIGGFGLASYIILQRPFESFSPPITPPVDAVAPVIQAVTSGMPSSATRQQSPSLPLPTVYGIYAVSQGQLIELEALPGKVPDQRIFMSAAIKNASRTLLPDGRVAFIAFRRDILASAPDRVAVRVIARIARAMTFNSTGSASVTPAGDEWAIRGTAYELRVAPVTENSEMLMFRSEDPEFALPGGRYGLVLKGQAFDFTVAGAVTEPSHCLERTEAANGTFYSECRKP